MDDGQVAAGEKDRRPRLGITVQYAVADRTGLPSRALLRRWAQAALVREAEVTLRFVDEAEGRRLNRDFRGKDYATNVLTFTYPPDPSPLTPHASPLTPHASPLTPYASPLTGDLVLCAPVIAREAAEQGKSLMAHYAHLVVHGLLHLQGYDHERRTEAVAMEAVERFILMRLGYPDPYVAR